MPPGFGRPPPTRMVRVGVQMICPPARRGHQHALRGDVVDELAVVDRRHDARGVVDRLHVAQHAILQLREPLALAEARAVQRVHGHGADDDEVDRDVRLQANGPPELPDAGLRHCDTAKLLGGMAAGFRTLKKPVRSLG